MIQLSKTLPIPEIKPENLPSNVKWLSGEGAGSWFLIQGHNINNLYEVYRYSPKGSVECTGIFESNHCIDLDKDYSLTYPSHCEQVTVLQYDKTIILKHKS